MSVMPSWIQWSRVRIHVMAEKAPPPSPSRVSVASVPISNPSIMANSTVMADVVVVTLALLKV